MELIELDRGQYVDRRQVICVDRLANKTRVYLNIANGAGGVFLVDTYLDPAEVVRRLTK